MSVGALISTYVQCSGKSRPSDKVCVGGGGAGGPHGPLPWIRHCSGTPPYDHPVYTTTSLLRPYSFDPSVKITNYFFLKSSLMLFDHLVITTRILWPNGGRINGVPLYSLQFFPYNSLGSSVGNRLNNQDILLLVIIVFILITFLWWSCDILRRYECHSYASRGCVRIFWVIHFATCKKSSEIEGNNTKQLIVNWKGLQIEGINLDDKTQTSRILAKFGKKQSCKIALWDFKEFLDTVKAILKTVLCLLNIYIYIYFFLSQAD